MKWALLLLLAAFFSAPPAGADPMDRIPLASLCDAPFHPIYLCKNRKPGCKCAIPGWVMADGSYYFLSDFDQLKADAQCKARFASAIPHGAYGENLALDPIGGELDGEPLGEGISAGLGDAMGSRPKPFVGNRVGDPPESSSAAKGHAVAAGRAVASQPVTFEPAAAKTSQAPQKTAPARPAEPAKATAAAAQGEEVQSVDFSGGGDSTPAVPTASAAPAERPFVLTSEINR